MERIQKVIAGAGVCSRREAERLIIAGEVSVNGTVVRELGTKVDPETDRIEVYGKKIRPSQPHVYIALHKPRGTVTTAKDPEGRPTVLDLMVGLKQRVYPVGRLDYNAEGLILLTNDGDLAFALMRPGGVAKTYRVKTKGTPGPEALDQLRRGLVLDGTPLLPVKAHVESRGETAWVRLTLHEGKQNQIVRMMEMIGHPVRRLRRLSVGPIQLGTLPSGRWRVLEPIEVEALHEAVEEAHAGSRASRRASPRPEGRSPSRARDGAAPKGAPSRRPKRAPVSRELGRDGGHGSEPRQGLPPRTSHRSAAPRGPGRTGPGFAPGRGVQGTPLPGGRPSKGPGRAQALGQGSAPARPKRRP